MDIPNYQNSQEEPSEEDEEKVKILNRQFQQNFNLTGWDQLFLKNQLNRALREIRFEKPSEVQEKVLPISISGKDILCQAKSGMGKTAVFVLSILQTLDIIDQQFVPFSALVLVHTRELAHQILKQFLRMSKYFKNPKVRISCFFGGIDIQYHIQELKEKPHVIIGTPGRLKELVMKKYLDISKLKYFVIDECDRILQNSSMRNQFLFLFNNTPCEKQVFMVSATFSESVKKECRKFLQNHQEIYVDPGQLTLHGLKQFYILLQEKQKVMFLVKILDEFPFNQTIIFANTIKRVKRLVNLLKIKVIQSFQIHSRLTQQERIQTYDAFKAGDRKILVATDLFGRGMDIERVNLVINFDFPCTTQSYLHRVGRAGRFGTKGFSINFINQDKQTYPYPHEKEQPQILEEVQQCYKVKILQFPKQLDIQKMIE